MSLWEDYQKVLLLGTQRSKVPELAVPLGLPQDIANHLQKLSPEAALCHGAQLLNLAQRIDVAPATGAFLALPAVPEETLPLLSAEAIALFKCLFDANNTDALKLFVHYAQGYRLPAVFLPQVLACWNKYYEVLHQGLLPMLGQRGIWLAQFNPDWQAIVKQYVLSSVVAEDTMWELGSLEERKEWLRQTFEADAERAKQQVRSSWSKESAVERKTWLEVWISYITSADEDFWEAALQDRSKGVQEVARRGMRRIPQSAWRRRMWARLQPCLPSREDPEWKLPTACTPDMVQDGIEVKVPKGIKRGERSWWLEQLATTATLDLLGDPHAWCDWIDENIQTYLKDKYSPEKDVISISYDMISHATSASTQDSVLLWSQVFADRKIDQYHRFDWINIFLNALPLQQREEQLYKMFQNPYYAKNNYSMWHERTRMAYMYAELWNLWNEEFSCFWAKAWYHNVLQYAADPDSTSRHMCYLVDRVIHIVRKLHPSVYSILNQSVLKDTLAKFEGACEQFLNALKFIELHARIQQLFQPAPESPAEV